MIEPVIYGDASLEPPTVPTHCAISGIRLQPGDAIGRIGGTSLSYGIAAQFINQLTHEKRVEIEAGTPRNSNLGVMVKNDTASSFRSAAKFVKEEDNG